MCNTVLVLVALCRVCVLFRVSSCLRSSKKLSLGCDESLKHSYYTRVGFSFSSFFYINYIVFVVRSLIWCLVWLQVYWSEKSSCWKQVLEQWGSEQGSDCHVATSPRRDVSTLRRCNVATSARELYPII